MKCAKCGKETPAYVWEDGKLYCADCMLEKLDQARMPHAECIMCGKRTYALDGIKPEKCAVCGAEFTWCTPKVGGTPGVKYDQEKPDWSLLPLAALTGVVRVLDHGAKKYSRENWRKVENGLDRYYAAAIRHLEAWQRGEELDPESGERHLDHAICCLIFLKEIGDER